VLSARVASRGSVAMY